METQRMYPEGLARKYRRVWLGLSVVDAFERTWRINPEKVAVVEGPKRLTYAELAKRACGAAYAFKKLGLDRGSSVLLQIPNSIEAIYVYLGLSMIGAVPVLCLPRHGRHELERFAKLTRATTWIGPRESGKTDYLAMIRKVKEGCQSLEQLVIVRDEAPPGTVSLHELSKENPPLHVIEEHLAGFRPSPDDVLHLAPTGGTTGLPKLVPKTHNVQLCRAYYWAMAAERGPGDVHLGVGPINHDAPQITNLAFLALFGGRLVFSPSPKAGDILECLEKERVTYCFMVPTLLADVANEPGLEKMQFAPDLKIGTGGAKAPSELVYLIQRRVACRFFNTYGMTEGAGTMTRATDPPDVIASTVGRKLCPFDQLKIVDEKGNELPPGQDGELVAQGPSIVSAYYRSPEDDSLAFTPDGFFRTGDAGRFDEKGNFIITGRIKDLIKRGGETVVPLEIEEMISEHPKVIKTAVVGMPDPRLEERICAYIQPRKGESVTFEELVSFLKEKGASKMLLPERLEIMEELPLTPSQKIDKQALRQDIAKKLKN